MNIKTGFYNKNIEKINPDEREFGAILYVTKDFNSLKNLLKNLDYKKLSTTLQYVKNDVIVDVFNGWIDTEIKVYARVDYVKRHSDYLSIMEA